jgi:GNAT superfamily N-acetyltransferase
MIRPVKPEDSSAICKLALQLGYQVTEEDIATRLDWILADQTHAIFVIEIETEVFGFVHVREDSLTLLSTQRTEIEALVVDQEVRGRGFGKLLMKKAEEWAAARYFSLMRLRSNINREQAHKFYESLGYTKTKTSYLFTKPIGKI